MSFVNTDHEPNPTKPLKKSKTGLEAEFHLLNSDGSISYQAEEVIKRVLAKHPDVPIVKEAGQNMIEFGSYPDSEVQYPLKDILQSIHRTMDVCEEMGLSIYPFSSYPTHFDARIMKAQRYQLQQQIHGVEPYEVSGEFCGFHHHYTLPRGLFDYTTKSLKQHKNSKIQRSMMSSYNYEIAADPGLTCYMQSSPFYRGSFLGKDSRMIAWRGGRKLKYPQGLFGPWQQLGGLPPYKQTQTDLMSSLDRRKKRWKKHWEAKTDEPFANHYDNVLDCNWNPVKINKHGTLEQKGMDIGLPSAVIATATLLSFSLKKIQEEFLQALPTDFGMDEPFKVENGMLFLPPHTIVRNKLQLWSAYKGYGSKKTHAYVKKLFSFQKQAVPKEYRELIKPVEEMVSEGESWSDRIMKQAKKKGWVVDAQVTEDGAKELALWSADLLKKDMDHMEKQIDSIDV